MLYELSNAAAVLFTGLRHQSLRTDTCHNLGELSLSEMRVDNVGCFQAVVQTYMNAKLFKPHDRLRMHMQISIRTD